MLFNSFSFVIFFPIVTLLYFIIPHRYRWFFLLMASWVFYGAFLPIYLLLLLLSIVIDYAAGLMIERSQEKWRKVYLIVSIVCTCGTLFIFKYFNFFNANLAQIARFFHWNYSIESLSLILPIGLSFYTFQGISYVIDVYRGHQKAEKHLGIFALYISFYPQLVAGPIERSGNLLPQFYEEHFYDDQRVMDGLKLMVWGFFKKVVIADRLTILVDQVYGHPTQYTGIPLIAAIIFFGIQAYCDFSGYSDIAVGSAQVMGFRLVDNFNKPFFYSTSTAEFWRRWHMSLMSWFRDYVYIPLGGNRKGKWRWYFNIFFTFALSGLWHGAKWGVVLWGALNGFYIIFSIWTERFRKQFVRWVGLDRIPAFHKVIQSLLTFMLFCIGATLFRAESLSDAYYVATHWWVGLGSWDGLQMSLKSLFGLQLNRYELAVALVSIGFMELIQKIEKQENMRHLLSEKNIWVRWPIYYLLLLFLIFFGEYNDQVFIYFQF